MFYRNSLKQKCASGKFSFCCLNSALNYYLNNNNPKLALDVAKEYVGHKGILRKMMINSCCENCPNIYLINDISKAKNEEDLISLIPAICCHMKCKEITMTFRVACEGPHNTEPLNQNDDLLTFLRKCYTILCMNNNDGGKIIEFFIPLLPSIQLKYIYKLTFKSRKFIYALCAWKFVPYMNNINYDKPTIDSVYEDFDIDESTLTSLPNLIYTRRVHDDYMANVSFEHLICNYWTISPRMPETELEKKGEELYLKTNLGKKFLIKPVIKCDKLDDEKVKLARVYILTDRLKSVVSYYCDLNNSGIYGYFMKGPYNSIDKIRNILYADYIKKLLKLNSPSFKVVEYLNCYYLLCKSLIGIDSENIVEQSTRIENVLVYTGAKYVFYQNNLASYSEHTIIQLFKILVYKKIIGDKYIRSYDIINRNGILISVSDSLDMIEHRYVFSEAVKDMKLRQLYNKLLKKHFGKIKEFINESAGKINADKIIPEINKTFILRQLMNLLKLENWKFSRDDIDNEFEQIKTSRGRRKKKSDTKFSDDEFTGLSSDGIETNYYSDGLEFADR